MSNTVISVENLWKEYRLGIVSHASLRKDLQSWWAGVRGKEDPNVQIGMGERVMSKEQRAESEEFKATDSLPFAPSSPQSVGAPQLSAPSSLLDPDRFWALRDVSFEVKQGEVLGIIGRNGAGKSTLLKIMSKVTSPTRGQIKIKGRVASLLEVGTGFHPELTGRENVFLNGAILGMSKEEIRIKFDEIVAFAEVDKFIDTPVKRYSSGMYVRLAFAVAAHLEPEILIVDEVLSVGDAQFQKKCLGKMGEVGKEGRTVLFVSHNMTAVENLCVRGVVLESGCLISSGEARSVVPAYLAKMNAKANVGMSKSGPVNLAVSVISENGKDGVVRSGERVKFEVSITTERPFKQAGFGIGIASMRGERIVTFHSHYQYNKRWSINNNGTCTIEWRENMLCPGTYILLAAMYDANQLIASWENVAILTVAANDYFGTGKLPDASHQGYVLSHADWTITTDTDQAMSH